jgi:hypothetical protein
MYAGGVNVFRLKTLNYRATIEQLAKKWRKSGEKVAKK